MMKKTLGNLVLQDLSCDDVNIRSLEKYDNSEIFFSIVMQISFKDEIGSNYFYFRLATPESLLNHSTKEYFLIKNRTIVIAYFDYNLLISSIEDILLSCSRTSWQDSVNELLKYFQWEYE